MGDDVQWSVSHQGSFHRELPTSLDRCSHISPWRLRKHLVRDNVQQLRPATQDPFAGSAWWRYLHRQQRLKEQPVFTFDLRYTTVQRHTVCLQIRPGPIEIRSEHNQYCSRRTPLIGALRPDPEGSLVHTESLRMITYSDLISFNGSIDRRSCKTIIPSTKIIPEPSSYVNI